MIYLISKGSFDVVSGNHGLVYVRVRRCDDAAQSSMVSKLYLRRDVYAISILLCRILCLLERYSWCRGSISLLNMFLNYMYTMAND